MTIWELLKGREITQSKALKMYWEGHYVGMLCSKHQTGYVFNPARRLIHETIIADCKDNLRDPSLFSSNGGGTIDWYDLSGFTFDFSNGISFDAGPAVYTTFGGLSPQLFKADGSFIGRGKVNGEWVTLLPEQSE